MRTRPTTNKEIREWYLSELAKLPDMNDAWIRAGIPLDERAYRAWDYRHARRFRARSFMKDPREVELLMQRDKEKYGRPDGPSFEFLLERLQTEGLALDQAYEAIIQGSYRTDEGTNKSLGS